MATLVMKTNGMITKLVNWSRDNSLASPNEKRGGRHDKNLDEKRIKNIINHTNSFNPQISHYTREHAPNRKYFPPELTVKYMWNEYASDSGNIAVSYSTYFKVFQTLNIGFSRPSRDECDVCQTWKNHEYGEGFVDGCATCVVAKEHLDSAQRASSMVVLHAWQQKNTLIQPERPEKITKTKKKIARKQLTIFF